jgi:hypothetical protein
MISIENHSAGHAIMKIHPMKSTGFPMLRFLLPILILVFSIPSHAGKGEAQLRWERMNQIRLEKFDLVLPEVMRENGVDMWITINREGLEDPLTEDFGKGYVGDWGYYIFTDRGEDRIERAALGIGTYLVEENGAYDIVSSQYDLLAFIQERNPITPPISAPLTD